jgi:hypothetical protein
MVVLDVGLRVENAEVVALKEIYELTPKLAFSMMTLFMSIAVL